MKVKQTLLATLPALALFSQSTLANMSVYPMEINVDASGAGQIKVSSKSDDIQFIRIKKKKIINPGTPQEKEIDVTSINEGALVVTPEKFALAAGSMRVVRLVSLMPEKKETAWRVYFEGVNQPDDPAEENGLPAGNAQAKVGVNIIWGALVHLAPESASVALSINTAKGTVFNSGTLRVPLKEIGICNADSKCKWVEEHATVYPDTERQLKALNNMARGSHYKYRYFDWLERTTKEAEFHVVN